MSVKANSNEYLEALKALLAYDDKDMSYIERLKKMTSKQEDSHEIH